MLIVKTPPIMAACPRGGFTRGSPWRRASPFLFLPTGPARAEFLFLRPPLKRRRIERHSHPPSPISLSLSLSPLPPLSSISSPLPLSTQPAFTLYFFIHLFISHSTPSFIPFEFRRIFLLSYPYFYFRETVERFDGVAITRTSVVVQD